MPPDNIAELLEEGLTKFGRGDLDGAMLAWEHALSLDPDNEQALSYVEYARDNYDLVNGGEAAEMVGAEEASPFGIEDDEYSIEIIEGGPLVQVAAIPYTDPLDEGWFMEEERIEMEADEPVKMPEPSEVTTQSRPLSESDAPEIEVSSPEQSGEFPSGGHTPGFAASQSMDSTPVGFAAQVTNIQQRDMGFVRKAELPPAGDPAVRFKPVTISPRPRSSTLSTPASAAAAVEAVASALAGLANLTELHEPTVQVLMSQIDSSDASTDFSGGTTSDGPVSPIEHEPDDVPVAPPPPLPPRETSKRATTITYEEARPRRASSPPELKMTLRTPTADKIEAAIASADVTSDVGIALPPVDAFSPEPTATTAAAAATPAPIAKAPSAPVSIPVHIAKQSSAPMPVPPIPGVPSAMVPKMPSGPIPLPKPPSVPSIPAIPPKPAAAAPVVPPAPAVPPPAPVVPPPVNPFAAEPTVAVRVATPIRAAVATRRPQSTAAPANMPLPAAATPLPVTPTAPAAPPPAAVQAPSAPAHSATLPGFVIAPAATPAPPIVPPDAFSSSDPTAANARPLRPPATTAFAQDHATAENTGFTRFGPQPSPNDKTESDIRALPKSAFHPAEDDLAPPPSPTASTREISPSSLVGEDRNRTRDLSTETTHEPQRPTPPRWALAESTPSKRRTRDQIATAKMDSRSNAPMLSSAASVAASLAAANEGTRSDIVLPFDPIDARSAQILDDIDEGAPANEPHDDRTRRRITALIEHAAEWEGQNELDKSVAAIDLALAEDPNSALAQKLIHRNRDTIMGVFQTFVGDLQRAPILARPLHELATAPISPRAAFLLSRVDGTMSIDEILDVSGMPRLEAYRYLCQLLLRGILR